MLTVVNQFGLSLCCWQMVSVICNKAYCFGSFVQRRGSLNAPPPSLTAVCPGHPHTEVATCSCALEPSASLSRRWLHSAQLDTLFDGELNVGCFAAQCQSLLHYADLPIDWGGVIVAMKSGVYCNETWCVSHHVGSLQGWCQFPAKRMPASEYFWRAALLSSTACHLAKLDKTCQCTHTCWTALSFRAKIFCTQILLVCWVIHALVVWVAHPCTYFCKHLGSDSAGELQRGTLLVAYGPGSKSCLIACCIRSALLVHIHAWMQSQVHSLTAV